MSKVPASSFDQSVVAQSLKLRQLEHKLEELIDNALARNTRDTYAIAFQSFRKFCNGQLREQNEDMAPEHALALYVAFLANKGMKPSTISTYLAGIKSILADSGVVIDFGYEKLKNAIAGHARQSNLENGIAKKDALSLDELEKILAMIDDTTIAGERDRTLLLVGFAGGFRRSELAAIKYSDLTFSDDGVVVLKRNSKGDRMKKGQLVGIFRSEGQGRRMMCPVAALEAWLELYQEALGGKGRLQEDTPVFPRMYRGGRVGATAITGESVLIVLRKHAHAAGVINAETEGRLGAHSLRAGLITTGYQNGADLRALAKHVHHKRLDTTSGYIREKEVFENNPTSKIFGSRS